MFCLQYKLCNSFMFTLASILRESGKYMRQGATYCFTYFLPENVGWCTHVYVN